MCIRDRLASREGAQGPLADISEAEQVERLLDPAAHDVTSHTERLHAVGELLLDGAGNEGGRRVLADDADDVREVAAIVEPDRDVLEPDHEVAPTSWRPPTGPAARSGGRGESQAGTSASSTPRAGAQGSIGHVAGDVCTTMPGTPRWAAIMTRTPAAAPHPLSLIHISE